MGFVLQAVMWVCAPGLLPFDAWCWRMVGWAEAIGQHSNTGGSMAPRAKPVTMHVLLLRPSLTFLNDWGKQTFCLFLTL